MKSTDNKGIQMHNCVVCGGSGLEFVVCFSAATHEYYTEEKICFNCQGVGLLIMEKHEILSETIGILREFCVGRPEYMRKIW